MKKIFLIVSILISIESLSQEKAKNQKERLAQYIGNWVSTDAISDSKPSLKPLIKMSVISKMDGNTLAVEVFQRQDSIYKLILTELISYDAVTDQIVAFGQNTARQCFVGKGFFDVKNKWVMEDRNLKNELTMKVTFDFISSTEVVLKGEVPNSSGWQMKYTKVSNK
ncbi:MAG: hypothetical protein ACKVOQ_16010 [Cyclobacteriaceae bacterium]